MNTSWFEASDFSYENVTKMTKLSRPAQQHLQSVYKHLTFMVASASVGAYAVYKDFYHASQLSFLASLACMGAFAFMQPTKENELKRRALSLGFAFIQGLCIGPLLQVTMHINPAIVTMSLFSTALIFASFSLSAIFSPRRSYIYLGGMLSSAISVLFFMSVANMFLGSRALWNAELWLGLLVFSGYVAYDSQVIIEKAERGSRDYMSHAFTLFIDAYNLFCRIMIILGKKEERKRRDEKRRN